MHNAQCVANCVCNSEYPLYRIDLSQHIAIIHNYYTIKTLLYVLIKAVSF